MLSILYDRLFSQLFTLGGCYGIKTVVLITIILEVKYMAKQGMKRIDRTHTKPRNDQAAVPEIQGKAKHGKERANPIIAGTEAPSQKVWHTTPYQDEKPIPPVYKEIDTDLARDNLEKDIPAADLQDYTNPE